MWYRVDGCRGIFDIGGRKRWRERAVWMGLVTVSRGVGILGIHVIGHADEKFTGQCRSMPRIISSC